MFTIESACRDILNIKPSHNECILNFINYGSRMLIFRDSCMSLDKANAVKILLMNGDREDIEATIVIHEVKTDVEEDVFCKTLSCSYTEYKKVCYSCYMSGKNKKQILYIKEDYLPLNSDGIMRIIYSAYEIFYEQNKMEV